ncbi:MAG: DMT family transporter [Planctomycetota bacterium]|nr:DMT family transporter [Planctomycetota bacterium]
MSTRTIALWALLGVTVIWGATFLWMKLALNAASEVLGPGSTEVASSLFLTMRFGVAAVLLPLFVKGARRRDALCPGLFGGAGLLGVLLLVGFLLQMIALENITPAVSAFLTSLYVIFTALLSLFSARHRHISPALFSGVALATLGAAFISGPPQLSFDTAEWLTVLCAFLFAGSILSTDHTTRRHPPAMVSLVSFCVVTLGAGGFLAYLLQQEGAPSLAQLGSLLATPGYLLPLLGCSLLATLVALTVLNHFQRHVSPVRAATLYSLEPVWGGILSIAVGAELLDPWLAGGAAALLLGNLVAELGPKKAS